MSLRDGVILGGMFTLAFVGWYYGWRFFQLKNEILGFEWFIIGFSATNFALYTIGVSKFSGEITYFLDLFSRLIGIPIIGTLGVLKVTHGRSFTRSQEFWMFAIGLLVSAAFVASGTLQAALPVLYLALGIAFLALCIFMAQQAFKRGLQWHGWVMTASVAATFGVSLLQDFVKLPDEDTAVFMNQLVIEHFVWAFACAAMFHVYRALHDARLGRVPYPGDHHVR